MEETHMHLDELTARLAGQAETMRSLVEGVAHEQARWKAGADQWSILEW
jgi:hypothetical protein